MSLGNKTIPEKADSILRMLGLPIETKIPDQDFFNRKALISMLEKWELQEKSNIVNCNLEAWDI
jgi:hypothetical protein